MNIKFVQTDSEDLISKSVEQVDGETIYVTKIGRIRHRSQLKAVLDEMALELQRDEQGYNVVSAPFRCALQLMNCVDEAARLGQFDTVLSNCVEASKLFPSMVEALRGTADAYFSLRQFAEAAQAYSELVQLYPDSRDIHYQLGRCLFELGKREEAIVEFANEMEISGEAPDIYLQIGTIHFLLAVDGVNPSRNLQEAELALERGIRIDPDFNGLKQCLDDVLKVVTK